MIYAVSPFVNFFDTAPAILWRSVARLDTSPHNYYVYQNSPFVNIFSSSPPLPALPTVTGAINLGITVSLATIFTDIPLSRVQAKLSAPGGRANVKAAN